MIAPLQSTGKLAERVEVIDATETLVERRTIPSARFSLLNDIIVSRGDKSISTLSLVGATNND